MHTVTLKLKTTKYDKDIIEKRFRMLSHVHNVLVKHGRVIKEQRDNDSEYQKLLTVRKEAKGNPEEKKAINKQLSEYHKKIGLCESGFQKYIKVCGKQFSKHLSSQQIQKEASRVWAGFKKVLYSDGKEVHFKKHDTFLTIGGKSNKNGVRFDKATQSIKWLGLNVQCKIPNNQKKQDYIQVALKDDISYCEIARKMFPTGWHYYVIIYLKGDAPVKKKKRGKGIVGIDLGVSTIAVVGEKHIALEELAPNIQVYNDKIEKISQKMDTSLRMLNPEYFNDDGTIKKGKKTWTFSKNYQKLKWKLKTLYRQKSAYIKTTHRTMINELLSFGNIFITEKMNFKALQKRKKTTEKQEKETAVKQKDGSVKMIHKYKKKKRFGRSLNNRSPGLFLELLKANVIVCEVNTKKFKASQYNHSTGKYKSSELNSRFKVVNSAKVQRDLYSAFLLKNSNIELEFPCRKECYQDFNKFIEKQNALIKKMKAQGITMKQCFGF